MHFKNVLSCFDGISCGQLALIRAGHTYDNYYASEVDKYAIKTTLKNFPQTIQLGDIKGVWSRNLPQIDLIMGGSPCQDLSIAGKRAGLSGERSGLFWHFVRLVRTCKPKYFLLENVASMTKENRDIISKALGVEPILINSALVSAQQRKRLYWTNIPGITQPQDKGILLKDILEDGLPMEDKAYALPARYSGYSFPHDFEKKKSGVAGSIRLGYIGSKGQGNRVYSDMGKSICLNGFGGGIGANTGLYCISSSQKHATISKDKSCSLVASMGVGGGHIPYISEKDECLNGSQNLSNKDYFIRKLTPIECERLQTLPDNYTAGVSNTQRYKAIGNGWTVDIIAHIFSFMEE